MKKFSNIVLIIALAFVVLGNILFWGPRLYRNIKADELDKNIGNKKYETEGFIDSIEANIEAADVNIILSDSFSCYFENLDLSRSDAYVSEGILHINARNYENMEVLGWNLGNGIDAGAKAKVTIAVPDDMLRSLKLEAGSGTIDIESISAENLVIQLGSGNLSVTGIKVTENGAVQLGGGSAKIYSLDARNMSIRTGVGNIDVRLASGIERYDISASVATGEIELPGTYEFGIDRNVKKAGDGTKLLTVESGAGSIAVR